MIVIMSRSWWFAEENTSGALMPDGHVQLNEIMIVP